MAQPYEDNYAIRMAPFIDSLPADEAVLIPLYRAYRAASEALVGVHNQPCFANELALQMIDEEHERACDHACAVAEKLRGLTSLERSQRESYIEVMLSHLFFTGGDESDVLRTLAAAMALRIVEEMSH